jgi:putative membrane protein
MGWAHRGMMGGGWGFMPFWYGGISMWIVLIILIGVVVYLIVRSPNSQSSGRQVDRDDPLEIAKRRYARGEITKEEYDQIKRDIL